MSWGKVDPDKLPDSVVCYTDSTIALPLLSAYVLSRVKPRKLKRLYDHRGHHPRHGEGQIPQDGNGHEGHHEPENREAGEQCGDEEEVVGEVIGQWSVVSEKLLRMFCPLGGNPSTQG